LIDLVARRGAFSTVSWWRSEHRQKLHKTPREYAILYVISIHAKNPTPLTERKGKLNCINRISVTTVK
jgi:hypothetical protein